MLMPMNKRQDMCINTIVLTATTGIQSIDQTLCAVIGIFEIAFEQRISGYYIEGSYADGSGISTSDLDLTIVFKNSVEDGEERNKAHQASN